MIISRLVRILIIYKNKNLLQLSAVRGASIFDNSEILLFWNKGSFRHSLSGQQEFGL